MNSRLLLKRAALLVLILVVIYAFGYVLTHGLLVVKGDSSEEKEVSVSRLSDGVEINNFKLTNNSKSLVMSKGDYVITVKNGRQKSVYGRSVGAASKKTVETKTMPQKKTDIIGNSEFNCSFKPASLTYFYSCDRYSGSFSIKSPGGTRTVIDSNAESQGNSEQSESQENNSKPPGFAAISSGGQFLSFVSGNNKLSVTPYDNNGRPNQSKIMSIDGFDGPLSQDNVSYATESSLAVFDQGKGELLIIDLSKSSVVSKISLSDKIQDLTPTSLVTVNLSSQYAFISVQQPVDKEVKGEHDTVSQEVYSVALQQPNSLKKIDLPFSGSVLHSGANTINQLLMLPSGKPDERKVYLAEASGSSDTQIYAPGLGTFCWKDKDVFYYVNQATNELYEHNVQENASYLVAGGFFGKISYMNCSEGTPYIAVSKNDDGDPAYIHMKLVSQQQSGERIEALLPLYVDVGKKETVKVSSKNGEYVARVVYDGDQNPNTPNSSEIQSAVKKKLSEYGVDVESINFKIER